MVVTESLPRLMYFTKYVEAISVAMAHVSTRGGAAFLASQTSWFLKSINVLSGHFGWHLLGNDPSSADIRFRFWFNLLFTQAPSLSNLLKTNSIDIPQIFNSLESKWTTNQCNSAVVKRSRPQTLKITSSQFLFLSLISVTLKSST